jgi:hypothetical protein
MKLRDYQIDIANRAVDILKVNKIVYISMEVRTGKTLTSLETAKLYGAKRVLFLTKKKAISSIQNDYNNFGYDFELTVTNDESMHKLEDTNYDLVIHDEHHRFGAFPKPGLATKTYKQMFGSKPMIFLSGTMTPESFTQVYHQFWVSYHSPFKHYVNFYRWADDYVNKFQKKINGFLANDYSKGNELKIMAAIFPYVITFTQQQAGFSTEIEEEVIHIDMCNKTKLIVKNLEKDLVVEGKDEVILADTPVKLMQKLHQLWSGTVKFESGNSMVIDTTKAEFIKNRWHDKKIGVFYKFKEELSALQQVLGDSLTTELDEFDNGDFKVIALQIVSGREGISLKNADYVVFYNIDFSATSYWQARDRMTTMDRKFNKVYWLFSIGGIEDKIYKAVKAKKKYTINIFKKDYEKQRKEII